jgi:two-component system, OmpR family, sensor histidine kinase KdpD
MKSQTAPGKAIQLCDSGRCAGPTRGSYRAGVLSQPPWQPEIGVGETGASGPESSCTLDWDDLLAATAHELRLPLSHIKGFVSTLRRTDVDWDESTRQDFLAEIEIETDRLTRLVDCLLEAADDGRAPTMPGRTLRTTQSPMAVVQGGLHRMRALLGDRAVQVELPAWLPHVRVDADALERVLANLLHNAAKHSPSRGLIRISARLVDFGTLEIVVDDNGPGIPAHDRERIFERFVRGDAKPPNAAGHGLGLAISRAIVRAHGGDIGVGEAPGGGARFVVRLPVEIAAAEARPAAARGGMHP